MKKRWIAIVATGLLVAVLGAGTLLAATPSGNDGSGLTIDHWHLPSLNSLNTLVTKIHGHGTGGGPTDGA